MIKANDKFRLRVFPGGGLGCPEVLYSEKSRSAEDVGRLQQAPDLGDASREGLTLEHGCGCRFRHGAGSGRARPSPQLPRKDTAPAAG